MRKLRAVGREAKQDDDGLRRARNRGREVGGGGDNTRTERPNACGRRKGVVGVGSGEWEW